MRTLFLSTSSNETTKYQESIDCLNIGPTEMVRYDAGVSEPEIYRKLKAWNPDMIVYIGSRWGPQPSIMTLAKINHEIAPMVHLCSDAADPPWHDLLKEYHYAGAFALQVAIDGNPAWPNAESGLTLLTPINPAHFPAVSKPHAERTIPVGYAGNAGSEGGIRRNILTELMLRNMLKIRMRTEDKDSYDGYCAFLSDCRLSLNISLSGTESTKQVKGRVIESALAGACLLEVKNSPTAKWFTPGVDFLEYGSVGEAVEIMQHSGPVTIETIANSLRARVLEEHSPRAFWTKVMNRVKP